jgi:hypothetical protein
LAAFQKRAFHIADAQAAGWYQRVKRGDGPNFEVYSTVPRPDVLDYYMVKIIGRVDNWGSLNPSLAYVGPSQYGWSEEDEYYWERRILYPWLFVPAPQVTPAPLPETFPTPNTTPVTTGEVVTVDTATEDTPGVPAQGGVLADDVLYNLSLLCANVLGPLKAKYPNMTVISGYRKLNNGISQHEKGEAADVQLNGQTDQTLYEVADYIAKNLQFDQLILNYSTAPKQSWIHVSINALELRRDVRTRNYDDVFYEGLYLVAELSGEARASAERTQQEDIAAVDTELTILAARDAKLNPPVVIPDVVPVDTLTITADESASASSGITKVTDVASGAGWTQESQGGGRGYD